MLPPTEDYYQIDGTIIQNGDGRFYMMWSGCDRAGIDNPTNLYIAPMSSPTQLSGPRVLLRTRTLSWEGTVLEAPQYLWNDDRLIIVFSANAYQNRNYCMGMIYLDNYSKSDPLNGTQWNQSIDRPVFETNDAERVYGPGHCSITFSRGKLISRLCD